MVTQGVREREGKRGCEDVKVCGCGCEGVRV